MKRVSNRLNKDWYQKKIDQNKVIKKHLVGIILENYSDNFFWSRSDLAALNYEDLFEIAVASANKKLSVTLGCGSDLSNGADCKFSIVRLCSKGAVYSAPIKNCSNKDHIYCCVYEGLTKKFYYFSFPAKLKEHTIPFNHDGTPKTSNYMWNYLCKNIYGMAATKVTFKDLK